MADADVVAQALLDTVVAALGASAPTRRYRTVGMPAWDAQGYYLGDPGGQLTVGLLRLIPGSPGRPEMTVTNSRNLVMLTAEYEIELVRPVPAVQDTGLQASAADQDASAVARMQEIQLVRHALRAVSVPGFTPPLTAGNVIGEQALSVLLLATTLKGPEGGALGMSTMMQVGL